MDVDEFDLIVATSLESPLVVNALGEESLPCERCGRLVAAREGAWSLHHSATCPELIDVVEVDDADL